MKASEPDAPVFVAYYDMVGWIPDRVEKFPKRERFVFGQRVASQTVDVLELIVSALYSRHPRKPAVEANRKLQTVRILLRLCADRKLISPRQ